MAYLDQDTNVFHREDYYLANIAAEIRRTMSKNPAKVSIKSFLLKFTGGKKRKESAIKKEAAEESKRRWLSWAGIKRK